MSLVKVMGGSENVTEQGARLNDEIGRPSMVKSEGDKGREEEEEQEGGSGD